MLSNLSCSMPPLKLLGEAPQQAYDETCNGTSQFRGLTPLTDTHAWLTVERT